MSTALVAQVLLYGLFTGSQYALLGLSWSIIFHTSRTFHFAHGLAFVAAAYTLALTINNLNLPFVVASILAVLMAMVVGCGIELGIYHPLRKAGATPFVFFISSLGVYVLGESISLILFGGAIRWLSGFPIISFFVGPVIFTTLHVLIAAVSATAILAVYLYLKRSKAGKALRAVACNPDVAEVVGIDREKAYLLAYALGSAMMALASIPWSLDKGVMPYMSFKPLFMGVVVTFIGGIGSIPGAVVGGLTLGLAENLSMLVAPVEYKMVVVFATVVIFIMVRPAGIFPSEITKLV